MKDLLSVFTPSLLRQLRQARTSWARDHPVTGKELIFVYFSGTSDFVDATKVAWPALKAMSKAYGPDNIPDMMSFLPNPQDPEFPEQTLGMLVLLGQAP